MMNIRSLLGRFIRFVSWLCFEHQWAQRELLTIAIIALVLLFLLIARRLRKESLRRTYANRLRERSPIIGVNIAEHKPIPQARPRKAIRQFKKLNEQLKQLQHENTKRRQIEVRLGQQLAELTTANEQLRHEVTEGRQTQKRLKQQVAELMAANERLQQEEFKQVQTQKTPAESSGQGSTSKSQMMPLNIEELRKTSELAKRVTGRLKK